MTTATFYCLILIALGTWDLVRALLARKSGTFTLRWPTPPPFAGKIVRQWVLFSTASVLIGSGVVAGQVSAHWWTAPIPQGWVEKRCSGGERDLVCASYAKDGVTMTYEVLSVPGEWDRTESGVRAIGSITAKSVEQLSPNVGQSHFDGASVKIVEGRSIGEYFASFDEIGAHLVVLVVAAGDWHLSAQVVAAQVVDPARLAEIEAAVANIGGVYDVATPPLGVIIGIAVVSRLAINLTSRAPPQPPSPTSRQEVPSLRRPRRRKKSHDVGDQTETATASTEVAENSSPNSGDATRDPET